MSVLRLRVDKWLDGDNLPNVVYGELKGPGIKGSRVVMLPAGKYEEWRRTNVDGGLYFLHVTLPSGQLVSRHIDVPPDAAEPINLVIEPPQSAHEYLSWPQFLGTVKSDLSLAAVRSRIEERFEQGIYPNVIDHILGPGSPRVELLGYVEESRQPVPVPLDHLSKVWVGLPLERNSDDPHYYCFETDVTSDEENLLIGFRPTSADDQPPHLVGPIFLRLFPEIGPPWIASLPIPWLPTLGRGDSPAEITIMLHAERENQEPKFALILRDWLMGPLLGYLESGQMGIVDTMLEQFLDNAESLLRQKVQNPYGAAAGALTLLKLQAYERLHDWPYNLASWFPWLADGAVVAGWCGLLGIPPNDEASSRFDGASPRNLFLAAASRGVPVFTESLHLLVEGLKRCLAAAQREHETDKELAEALKKMRLFGRACDSRQPFTMFRGESPLEPMILEENAAALTVPD